MRADDDFKSISIRAYLHMCSKSYLFGTVNSIAELNETYSELVTTLNAATRTCKKCQDYGVLSKLANKPTPKNIIEKDKNNPMLHKTCLIDRTYYRDRLHELEKRRDEWEEQLNFAQINLNSINNEINKLREYVFEGNIFL